MLPEAQAKNNDMDKKTRSQEDRGLTDHNPNEGSYFVENDDSRYKKKKSKFGNLLEAIWECLK